MNSSTRYGATSISKDRVPAPRMESKANPDSKIFTTGKITPAAKWECRQNKFVPRKSTYADVLRVFRQMSGIDLSKEPSWVQCPKCGGTWTKLTSNGICINCEEKTK